MFGPRAQDLEGLLTCRDGSDAPIKQNAEENENENEIELQQMTGSHLPQLKSLDECLEDINVSWFQYELLLLCGLMFMADAMEVMLLSFLSICAGADLNLSHAEVASISSVVFAGELVGGMVWGPLADSHGRRFAFIVACLTMTVGGLLSGFAPNYYSLLAFRGICGLGVGGITVPFDLLAEYLPASQRGRFLMAIEYFWTAGSVFVVLMAWGLLQDFDWRVLAITTTVPVGVAGLLGCAYLPESVRWLCERGRVTEAEEYLRVAARRNGTNLGSFRLARPAPTPPTVTVSTAAPVDKDHLCSDQVLRVTIPLMLTYLASSLLYNGVIFFISRLYNDDGEGADGAEFGGDADYVCSFNYAPILANSIAEAVGVTLAILFIDRAGRVRVQWTRYLTGGAAVLAMGLHSVRPDGSGGNNTMALAVLGMVARAAAMSGISATWISTPEIYPTQLRASAHSYCNVVSRLSAFASPYIVFSGLSNASVGVVLCGANLLAALASCFLPESADKSMDELDWSDTR